MDQNHLVAITDGQLSLGPIAMRSASPESGL
jgi:hypothetical protein